MSGQPAPGRTHGRNIRFCGVGYPCGVLLRGICGVFAGFEPRRDEPRKIPRIRNRAVMSGEAGPRTSSESLALAGYRCRPKHGPSSRCEGKSLVIRAHACPCGRVFGTLTRLCAVQILCEHAAALEQLDQSACYYIDTLHQQVSGLLQIQPVSGR